MWLALARVLEVTMIVRRVCCGTSAMSRLAMLRPRFPDVPVMSAVTWVGVFVFFGSMVGTEAIGVWSVCCRRPGILIALGLVSGQPFFASYGFVSRCVASVFLHCTGGTRTEEGGCAVSCFCSETFDCRWSRCENE